MPTPANSINEATTGICGFTGTAFTSTAVTAHDVLIGGSTSSTIAQAAPSSTSGVPLISQGASSDPVFGTAVVAGGGTGNTTFTAYSVIAAGTTATGAFQNVSGVGTSGQVLTSAGASALPTWSSAGSMVFLAKRTGSSSATLDFTSVLSSTYNNYCLIVAGVTTSSADAELQILVSSNNGGAWIVTNYAGGYSFTTTGSTSIAGNTATTSGRSCSGIKTSSPGMRGTFYFSNTTNSIAIICNGHWFAAANDGTTYNQGWTNWTNTSTAVNALRMQMSAGNIATGTFSLYGILEA